MAIASLCILPHSTCSASVNVYYPTARLQIFQGQLLQYSLLKVLEPPPLDKWDKLPLNPGEAALFVAITYYSAQGLLQLCGDHILDFLPWQDKHYVVWC